MFGQGIPFVGTALCDRKILILVGTSDPKRMVQRYQASLSLDAVFAFQKVQPMWGRLGYGIL